MLNTFQLYKELNEGLLHEKLKIASVDKPLKYEPTYKMDWDELKRKPSDEELKQFYL